MPRTEQDVRTNPIAGDVVIYGPQHQRERVDVIAATDDKVFGLMNASGVLYSKRQWLEWMATVEVLHIAQEDPHA